MDAVSSSLPFLIAAHSGMRRKSPESLPESLIVRRVAVGEDSRGNGLLSRISKPMGSSDRFASNALPRTLSCDQIH
jgi:hypothetical protein